MVGVTVDRPGREETVEEMEQLRFSDFEAWKGYQSEVLARTDHALDAVTEESLAQVLLPKLPPNMQNIFCGIVIGKDAPLRKLDVLECFVYQHGLRHMGEIEHGRALVGLGGMTS
jgi:hypothetical protein